MASVTAIVLAGGSSSRFGSDKLSMTLPRALEAARAVADEVIAVGRRVEGAITVDDDASLPCGGPPRGVASALRAASGDIILVVPGDAAFVAPGALRSLLGYANGSVASVLMPGGSVAATFIAGPREALERAMQLACLKASLGLRARATDLLRASGAMLVGSGLLGGSRSFIDVDRPEDLIVAGAPRGPRRVVRVSPSHYARALELLRAGRRREAALEFTREAREHRALRVRPLELHALLDAASLGLAARRRIARLRDALGREGRERFKPGPLPVAGPESPCQRSGPGS